MKRVGRGSMFPFGKLGNRGVKKRINRTPLGGKLDAAVRLKEARVWEVLQRRQFSWLTSISRPTTAIWLLPAMLCIPAERHFSSVSCVYVLQSVKSDTGSVSAGWRLRCSAFKQAHKRFPKDRYCLWYLGPSSGVKSALRDTFSKREGGDAQRRWGGAFVARTEVEFVLKKTACDTLRQLHSPRSNFVRLRLLLLSWIAMRLRASVSVVWIDGDDGKWINPCKMKRSSLVVASSAAGCFCWRRWSFTTDWVGNLDGKVRKKRRSENGKIWVESVYSVSCKQEWDPVRKRDPTLG